MKSSDRVSRTNHRQCHRLYSCTRRDHRCPSIPALHRPVRCDRDGRDVHAWSAKETSAQKRHVSASLGRCLTLSFAGLLDGAILRRNPSAVMGIRTLAPNCHYCNLLCSGRFLIYSQQSLFAAQFSFERETMSNFPCGQTWRGL